MQDNDTAPVNWHIIPVVRIIVDVRVRVKQAFANFNVFFL